MRRSFVRPLVIGAALALTGVGAAWAAPLDGLFNSTIVVAVPNFGVFKTMYHKDNTYNSSGPMGAAKGTWALKADQICRTQTDPAPMPPMGGEICNKADPHKVGDKWQVTAMGQTFEATMVAGQTP